MGHLFLDHCEKEDGIPHKNMPRFKEDWYSCDPCSDIKRDPLFYGRKKVEDYSWERVAEETEKVYMELIS